MGDFRSSIRTNKYPIIGLVPETAPTASAPSAPVQGQIYFDSDLVKHRARLASAWVNFIMEGDPRLTDTRAPSAHTHPTSDVTGLDAALANRALANRQIIAGTGLTGGGDLTADRTLAVSYGTAAGTAAQGNDVRLSDARTPTGNAGGVLSGTYPNPGLANLSVAGVNLALALIATGYTVGGGTGTAATTVAALRALGFGAHDALAGTTRLDQIAAPTAPVSMNSQRQTNLADPVNPQDSATKNYVDNAIQGLDAKQSVHLATTANITLSGNQTIDGVATVAGDRVLVKNQSTASQNGIYIAGTGSWTRATDMDTWAEVPGAFVFVEEGTANGDTGWVSTANLGGTLNTTAIGFVQFSSAGVVTASGVLTKTGNDITLQFNGTTFTNTAGVLNLAVNGVAAANLADGAVSLTGTKITGILGVANGGTGSATAAGARANLGAAGAARINAPALTADTWSASIPHNLNVAYPSVTIWDTASGEVVELDVKSIDANNVQIRSGGSAAAGAYVVSIAG